MLLRRLKLYYINFSCHHPFRVLVVTKQVYIINILNTPTLKDKYPYDILFQDAPKYDSIKDFGCLCYPWLTPYEKKN